MNLPAHRAEREPGSPARRVPISERDGPATRPGCVVTVASASASVHEMAAIRLRRPTSSDWFEPARYGVPATTILPRGFNRPLAVGSRGQARKRAGVGDQDRPARSFRPGQDPQGGRVEMMAVGDERREERVLRGLVPDRIGMTRQGRGDAVAQVRAQPRPGLHGLRGSSRRPRPCGPARSSLPTRLPAG